jgi:hypothetical protein
MYGSCSVICQPRAREKTTWQHVAAQLDAAARGADAVDAAVALQLVLMLEKVPFQRK